MRRSSLIFLPLVLVAVGCTAQQEAVRFNNDLTKGQPKLTVAHEKFFEVLNKSPLEIEEKMPELRAAHAECIAIWEKVKEDVDALEIPDSKQAQKFYDAQVKYLESQEKVIKEDYAEMIAVLEQSGPKAPNGEEKQQQLMVIEKRAHDRQHELIQEVGAAQEEFAKEYNLILKPAS